MLTEYQTEFLKGRIYAIKARLEKAQHRIERQESTGSAVSVTEQEKAHRLAKVLEVHQTNPEEAILLYNK
jgi:septal ring factor EnvC (AmiA/AmiB activator)